MNISTILRACLKTPERGSVVLDQPQQVPKFRGIEVFSPCCGWSSTQPRSIFRKALSIILGTLLTASTLVAHDGEAQTGRRPGAASTTISPTNQLSGGPLTNALPPLPPGVTELKFNEFFRQPIGPRGLEYADKLRGLDGQRIRILGYMVRQEKPVPGGFLLAPQPISLHEGEFGLCDDLPAALLHVFADAAALAEVPYTPGLLLLTGRLSVGNRTEADGRISTVRLQLDPPTPEQRLAATRAAEALAKQKASQPDPHAGHHH